MDSPVSLLYLGFINIIIITANVGEFCLTVSLKFWRILERFQQLCVVFKIIGQQGGLGETGTQNGRSP